MWTILGCVIFGYWVAFPFAYLAIAYELQLYAPAWFVFSMATGCIALAKLSNWEQNRTKEQKPT